jgi:hypothetical protein
MKDDGSGGLTGNFLPEDPDTVDALRLAEVLERVESGRAPDLDPTEDPSLSHLLLTAMRIRSELGAISNEHAFQSFRTRSRSAILHSLEPSRRVVPFYRRPRILAPLAAVAAAAAIAMTSFGPSLLAGDRPSTAVATNLTPRTTSEELDRLAVAIADIQERAQSGQPVPAPLLRAVSEGTARVANLIEQSPERVSKETVTSYIQAAQSGQTVLKSVTVAQDAEGALAAAQRAANDGVVVAGRFLNAATSAETATPTGTPAASPTGTPSASATATPTGTASVTPSPTPGATGSATATPTGSATPGTTPSATATPADGATPRPTAPSAEVPSDIVR